MSATAPERPRLVLSRTARGWPVPDAHSRARDPLRLHDRFLGWIGPVAVTLLALFLRLWRLGHPRAFAFDETYYAKDAWALLKFGYVQDYVEDANAKILDGQTSHLWTGDPSMVVHPEVGKWLIALGEAAFGLTPFGWRISAAVAGSLMVLVMCRLVRRLTRSTLLGCVAGLLLSLDGLQLVLSRMALLDIFLAFFLTCGVACLVADRGWFRERLADRVEEMITDDRAFGPIRGLLLRPWLLAAGVSFGLAVGTKWTALYPLAAFGIMVWVWSAGARRSFGVRMPLLKSALADGVAALFSLVGVALVVYIATWTGWLLHADKYEDHLASTQYRQFVAPAASCKDPPHLDPKRKWPTAAEPDAKGLGEFTQSLRSLWYYHQDVYTFHTQFLNCSDHPYQSQPSAWLLLNRPVGVDAQLDIAPGTQGCTAARDDTCLRQVLLLGNPVLWWGGVAALVFSVVAWVFGRDWRFGLAVVGTASTWLPWLMYDDRPIFLFYASAILPFLVIAVTLTMGELIGPWQVRNPRRTVGVIVSGAFFVLVLLTFAWFWPIWTDALITHHSWLDRMWFQRWI